MKKRGAALVAVENMLTAAFPAPQTIVKMLPVAADAGTILVLRMVIARMEIVLVNVGTQKLTVTLIRFY